jgi:hypothetical protein
MPLAKYCIFALLSFITPSVKKANIVKHVLYFVGHVIALNEI